MCANHSILWCTQERGSIACNKNCHNLNPLYSIPSISTSKLHLALKNFPLHHAMFFSPCLILIQLMFFTFRVLYTSSSTSLPHFYILICIMIFNLLWSFGESGSEAGTKCNWNHSGRRRIVPSWDSSCNESRDVGCIVWMNRLKMNNVICFEERMPHTMSEIHCVWGISWFITEWNC